MTKNIAVIRGDGIGPEIVEQAALITQMWTWADALLTNTATLYPKVS